jgi:hypothetical protein
MNLPPELVRLISEYSKPCTRPNWRQSKPIISTYKMYLLSKKIKKTSTYTYYDSLLDNIKDTDWFYAYKTISDYGLFIYYQWYFNKYGVHESIPNVLEVDGLREAIMNN